MKKDNLKNHKVQKAKDLHLGFLHDLSNRFKILYNDGTSFRI